MNKRYKNIEEKLQTITSNQTEDLDEAEHIMIVGSNPRDEAPVLNARIRKAWAGGANIELVGLATDLTYDYEHLGENRAALKKLHLPTLF